MFVFFFPEGNKSDETRTTQSVHFSVWTNFFTSQESRKVKRKWDEAKMFEFTVKDDEKILCRTGSSNWLNQV